MEQRGLVTEIMRVTWLAFAKAVQMQIGKKVRLPPRPWPLMRGAFSKKVQEFLFCVRPLTWKPMKDLKELININSMLPFENVPS